MTRSVIPARGAQRFAERPATEPARSLVQPTSHDALSNLPKRANASSGAPRPRSELPAHGEGPLDQPRPRADAPAQNTPRVEPASRSLSLRSLMQLDDHGFSPETIAALRPDAGPMYTRRHQSAHVPRAFTPAEESKPRALVSAERLRGLEKHGSREAAIPALQPKPGPQRVNVEDQIRVTLPTIDAAMTKKEVRSLRDGRTKDKISGAYRQGNLYPIEEKTVYETERVYPIDEQTFYKTERAGLAGLLDRATGWLKKWFIK